MHKVVLDDLIGMMDRVDMAPLHEKKILITGGTGLIGSYLLSLFSYLGESRRLVISIDSISKSMVPQSAVEQYPGINFIRKDLGKEFELVGAPRYDFIIHAAGYGQPKKFLADEISTLILNGSTTIKLAEYLKDGGTYLFLSTSEVYLGSQDLPYKEIDCGQISPEHPRAPYVVGKSYGETVLASLERRGVNSKVARIALAYGPGTKEDDERVLNQLIKRGIVENAIHLLDQGRAIRTYCYVADTVEMLLRILLHGKSLIYNVGGISKVSIRELAYLLGELLDVEVTASNDETFLVGAPSDVALDLTKYRMEFGEPDFQNLRNGLSKTIEWQRDNLYSGYLR